MSSHNPTQIIIYNIMVFLILGVNRLFCFLKLFLLVGKGLTYLQYDFTLMALYGEYIHEWMSNTCQTLQLGQLQLQCSYCTVHSLPLVADAVVGTWLRHR